VHEGQRDEGKEGEVRGLGVGCVRIGGEAWCERCGEKDDAEEGDDERGAE